MLVLHTNFFARFHHLHLCSPFSCWFPGERVQRLEGSDWMVGVCAFEQNFDKLIFGLLEMVRQLYRSDRSELPRGPILAWPVVNQSGLTVYTGDFTQSHPQEFRASDDPSWKPYVRREGDSR